MKRNVNSNVIIAGFAIFSMVFGSGNIVFPLIVGKVYYNHWIIAAVGWLLSGVLIHFMGDFSAILYDADNNKFFKPLGKYITFFILLSIMILVGPFGGIARNVNVSFDCVKSVLPTLNGILFKGIYCILLTVLAWNPGKLVDLIGKIFTPIKFCGVFGIIIMALLLLKSSDYSQLVPATAINAFTGGLNLGYQTMDMLTAFMAMDIIYSYIKSAIPENQQRNKKFLIRSSIKTFIIAGALLSVIYVGLIYLGHRYAPLLQETENAALFPKIAELAMGTEISWAVAIVITMCCLATNIALTSIFSNYLYKNIFNKKIEQKKLIVATGGLTFVMSLLGFNNLCVFMGKILSVLYPLLIVFVIVRIVQYYTKKSKLNL